MKIFLSIVVCFVAVYSRSWALKVPQKVIVLEGKIISLNSDLTCESDENCVALPVGYKPCGGPDRYIIASKENKKFKELRDTIDKHYKADKEWKIKQNIFSACNMTKEPISRCQIKECNSVEQLKPFVR